MKKILLLLFAPLFAKAQTVNPVVSDDYLRLIKNDSAVYNKLPVDTTNSMNAARLKSLYDYYGYTIGRIKIKKDVLAIMPPSSDRLFISGNFTTAVEIKKINRLPALQTNYVQGRSQNGSLVWRGPETNEMFSYGPSIQSLEYDGGNYAFDKEGRLVTKGMGNSNEAAAYSSSIFRNGAVFSNSLFAQGRYMQSGWPVLIASLRVGQRTENLYIKNNRNSEDNIFAMAEALVKKWLTITASYTGLQERYANFNRNGFLNIVYQNALLTPISFDNTQGIMLGNLQRAYSNMADNPFYLLQPNNNSYILSHKIGSLSFEKKRNNFRFKLTQSLEKFLQQGNEGMPQATAFFSNGNYVNRNKTDINYLLKAASSYDFRHGGGYFNSTLTTNYLYSNNGTAINYNPGNYYRYQRSANELSANFATHYRNGNTSSGIIVGNKTYFSNTQDDEYFFLPDASAYILIDRLFDSYYWSVKLSATYNKFVAEPAVSTSYSQNNLLQHSTQNALQYFPVTEAIGLDNLSVIRHNEWSTRLDISYRNKLNFQAEFFKRKISDDVFPVFESGVMQLRNVAGHQNQGFEFQASYYSYARKVQTTNTISFFTNQAKVTDVKQGYNNLPIAGFSTVYKTLVEGEEMGVITGNRFLRDAANNVVIGSDGFPLVNPTNGIIGRVLPDFTVKASHTLSWKNFSFNCDVEWKKGGQVWNGTQAVLDYYGRSEKSAALRNTTNYVFNGVLIDGKPNTTPVNFYDPSQPFEKNRWVRYGHSGVAEEYIENGDHVRLNTVGISYKLLSKKYIQHVTFSLYTNNIFIWSAYSGVDANRLLYDAANTSGLDYFNLPSVKTFGANIAIQF